MFDKTTLIAAVAVTAMVSSNAHAQRGGDGHLNILYWQAASTVNPYLSGGTKDIEAASPGHRAARPLRRERQHGAGARRRDPHGGERGGGLGSAQHHLEAHPGHHVVGRHAR